MKKLTMLVLAGLVSFVMAACDHKGKHEQEGHNAEGDVGDTVVTPMGTGDTTTTPAVGPEIKNVPETSMSMDKEVKPEGDNGEKTTNGDTGDTTGDTGDEKNDGDSSS